jgi:exodeoxyribonuclease VII large subunit
LNEARSPSFVVTVGEFAMRLRNFFRRVRAFEYIGISGEISQWNPRQNGVYFTIKDAYAVLECFAYANRAQRFPKVALGTAVIAYGAVRVQERRSRYELLVDDLQLTGIGELYQQYEALKEKFRKEGLFERERKRAIPRFPRTVVLVSARGKGAEDFQKVLRERAPHVNVEFVETRVQGVGAEVEIAEAMDRAGRIRADAIVLARGGGSYEDLFAFNLEPVVRAIVRSPIPVITGIGHTGDHHLADDVADLACETPSNAAQLIANLWQRGNERLERLSAALDREMRDVLVRSVQRADLVDDALERAWERATSSKRERLGQLERALIIQNPQQRLANRMQHVVAMRARLDAWPARAMLGWQMTLGVHAGRVVPAWERYGSELRHRLEKLQNSLRSADPNRPLERGYALIMRDGMLVRSAEDVKVGETIEARLAHGGLRARVEEVKHDE